MTARPGKPRLRKLVLFAAAVAVLAGAGTTIWYLASDDLPTRTELQLLEAAYGPPPGFTIIFARDNTAGQRQVVRREIWVYPEKCASFVFADGKFLFSSDLATPPAPAGCSVPSLRPADITSDSSLGYLSKKLGGKATRSRALQADVLPEAVRYDFGCGATAVFQHDQLIFVQITPTSG